MPVTAEVRTLADSQTTTTPILREFLRQFVLDIRARRSLSFDASHTEISGFCVAAIAREDSNCRRPVTRHRLAMSCVVARCALSTSF